MGEWTKERIEAAEKRCEKATDGPWLGDEDIAYDIVDSHGEAIADVWSGTDDTVFIAAARTDLPDALAEIKAAAVALDAEISRSDKAADRPYSLAERIEFVIAGLDREARRGDCAEDEVKRLTLRIQGLEQANREAHQVISKLKARGECQARAGIYLASKSEHGPRWQALRASGVPIVSTWIDESGKGQTSDWGDLWARSVREASTAAAFVMYVEPGEIHRGSLVEFGAALHAGVPVFWVGPEVGSVRRARGVTVCETIEDAIGRAVGCSAAQDGLAGLRSVVADKAAQVTEDVVGQALTVASGAQAVASVAVASRESRLHALFEKFMPMLLEEQTRGELGITCPCGATATDYTVDGLNSKPVCADFPRCKSRTTDEHVGHRIPTLNQAVIGAREPADLARRFDRAYLDALGKDPDDATDEDAHRARAKALGTLDRESLGRMVREAWVLWAREQPNPKDSWLVPWEGLSEPDKEVDRRIGETIARHALRIAAHKALGLA